MKRFGWTFFFLFKSSRFPYLKSSYGQVRQCWEMLIEMAGPRAAGDSEWKTRRRLTAPPRMPGHPGGAIP